MDQVWEKILQKNPTQWAHLGTLSGQSMQGTEPIDTSKEQNTNNSTNNSTNSSLSSLQHDNPPHSHDSSKASSVCNQASRQAALHQACNWARSKGFDSAGQWKFRYNNTFRYMFVDDTHKILYCELPKAGCTSWKAFFAMLNGNVHPDDYHLLPEYVHNTDFYPLFKFKYLSDYSHQERVYRLKHYFKFLVVRNPFNRLVSAYEDKFLHDKGRWYPFNVGGYITKNYRLNKTIEEKSESTDNVKFEELVRFIVNETERMKSKYDPHWSLMQSQCYPCLFNYDYIGKLETLQHDLPFLMEKFTSNGVRPSFPFMNSNPSKHVNLTAYYGRLASSEMVRLREFYKIDSRMFGYSLHDNNEECQ